MITKFIQSLIPRPSRMTWGWSSSEWRSRTTLVRQMLRGLAKLLFFLFCCAAYVSQVRFMPTSVLPSSAFVVALGWGQVSDGKKIENNYIFYENIIMCIVGCLPTRNMFINVFFNSFAKPALYNNNCYLISLQMIMCRIMIFITLM
jgi:hypothetical protein